MGDSGDTSHADHLESGNRSRFETDDTARVAAIVCYRWSASKMALFICLSLLSLGMLPLFVLIRCGKSSYAEFIRLSHKKCSLDRVTVFLVKIANRKATIVSRPLLITTNNDLLPSKGGFFKTFTPLNRSWLSAKQNVFFEDEFLNENDSASAFEVHNGNYRGDLLHAGVDLGDYGVFFWNPDKQRFQRVEVPRKNISYLAAPLETIASIINVGVYQQTFSANDAQFIIELFRRNIWKSLVFYFATLISGGLLVIVCTWKPSWRLFLTCDRVDFAEPHLATCVKMTDANLKSNVWTRKLWLSSRRGVLLDDDNSDDIEISIKSNLAWRFFIFESTPFVLDAKCNQFVPGPVLLEEMLRNNKNPRTIDEYHHPWARRVLCGFNVMPVPLTPIWLIIWYEAVSPLYFFQFGCCAMWFAVEYTIYAICLLIFSFFTISWSVYVDFSNERAVWHAVVGDRLRDPDEQKVKIIPDQNDEHEAHSSTIVTGRKLLPGDIVSLEPIRNKEGNLPEIPADFVLLKGSCLVDESMLSGEVTPVSKFAWSQTGAHDEKPLERNMLHSGTKLLTLSPGTVGKVTSIGFSTTRGRLVRAVLRPTPADRRFTIEALKFLGALGIIGFIGLLYSAIIRSLRHEDAVLIVLMCIILISIIVPPQISVVLTIAQVIAQMRLKTKRIFCTNPKSITPTGSVDLVCFDKTGTLTEEMVKLKHVIGIEYNVDERNQEIKRPTFSDTIPHELELCAACCNSVTQLPESLQNMSATSLGDPIDVELLQFAQFSFVSDGRYVSAKEPGLKIELVKNFGFSAERRSSCVIAKVCDLMEEPRFFIFLKGAPEHVLAKCLSSSIPRNISQVIDNATNKGLRLILLASRRIEDSEVTEGKDQDSLESKLQLLGISFFENILKQQTKPTIRKLHKAALRTLMITGDDVRTALATARQCGIIDEGGQGVLTINEIDETLTSQLHGAISASSFIHLTCEASEQVKKQIAITEKAWQVLRQEAATNPSCLNALKEVLRRGAVFARFRPDQKAEVVNEFRKRLGFVVAMVGDGANDCYALKAADVGIALTEAEASIASAFTCKDRNISPIIDIFKEGRCSLTSMFGLFSVMVSYSCVQFCSACLLYWMGANCTDLEFLYIDLFLLTTLSLTFPLVPAFRGAISIEQPNRHLLSVGQIAPIIAHNIVNVGFQILAYLYVRLQPWFLPYNVPEEAGNLTSEFNSFEVFSLYSIAIFQYLSSAFIFARGAPFRSSFFRSRLFTAHLIVLFIFNHFIVLYLPESIRSTLKIFPPPSIEYRVTLILIAYINFASSFLAVRGVQEIVEHVKLVFMKSKLQILVLK